VIETRDLFQEKTYRFLSRLWSRKLSCNSTSSHR